MKPVFRIAVRDDLASLLEIENHSFALPNWTAADFLRYETVVAEVAGEVAGFVVARQTFSGSADSPAEREILNVAVAPRFRRLGIATALLEHALRQNAVYFLEVRESNQIAQSLYRKLAFVPIARRAEYYENPREAAIVMQMKRC